MPKRLVDRKGLSAGELAQQMRDRTDWLKSHGLDPGDWSQVFPVLNASWRRHGIDSALDRAARREGARRKGVG